MKTSSMIHILSASEVCEKEGPYYVLKEARNFCATCAVGTRRFAGRYREFLLDPGTLFAFVSLLLLVAAGVVNPGGLLSGGEVTPTGRVLYFASAIVGSAYIWWSAIQGIRERDFTADIPVSIATAAAIAIGAYSAAAVVAVLLLLGGMLEEFVAARAGRALEALERLLPDRVTVRREGCDAVVALEEVREGTCSWCVRARGSRWTERWSRELPR